MNEDISKFRKKLRTAVADYMYSEGCSCCRNCDSHEKHSAILAKLLNAPKYKEHGPDATDVGDISSTVKEIHNV